MSMSDKYIGQDLEAIITSLKGIHSKIGFLKQSLKGVHEKLDLLDERQKVYQREAYGHADKVLDKVDTLDNELVTLGSKVDTIDSTVNSINTNVEYMS